MSEFAKLLDLLDRDPNERVSLCTIEADEFRAQLVTVGDLPARAEALDDRDAWYGTGVLHPRVTSGRGKASDVAGVRELYADLDVKPGGMPDYNTAEQVIGDLAGMLGVAPVAVVASGHGLQPHWQIERDDDTDWPDETDPRHAAATALFRRWHRLVTNVAEIRGGQVDTVSDLSRVLRVPGTTNRKQPDRPAPVRVHEFPGGGAVSLDRLRDTLDEYNVPEQAGDADTLGEIVAPPEHWRFAEHTCNYVKAMLAGWAEDTPGTSGRHPWLVSQGVRLAAAHRAAASPRRITSRAGKPSRRGSVSSSSPATPGRRPAARSPMRSTGRKARWRHSPTSGS
jgi:hypothetical protein